MGIYYFNFLVLIIFYILDKKISRNKDFFIWNIFIFYLILFVGFRDSVGGDWWVYEENFNQIKTDSIYNSLFTKNEIGYSLISVILKYLNFKFHYVNLICATIFIISLSHILKKNKNKYLGLIISYPILIIVISMGFTRQSVAIGLFFVAIFKLYEDKYFQYIFLVLLASIFHYSSLIFIIILPTYLFIKFIFFEYKFNTIRFVFFLFLVFFIFILFLFYYPSLKSLIYIYLKSDKTTRFFDYPTGASFRIFLNLLPSIIIIFFHKTLFPNDINKLCLSVLLSLICIFLSFLYFYFPVFVDRYMFYLIIIQIILFSNIENIFRSQKLKMAINFSIISYYLIVFLVWINFATHVRWWHPYNNYLFYY